jgi:2-amino-4-hydroxy-6-hydroxymethyldihydropteridine diphosphokinase
LKEGKQAKVAMAHVNVAIGSNIEPKKNITSALNSLKSRFGVLKMSKIYRTAPIGVIGHDFYNLAVGFDTDDPVELVVAKLKSVESEHGRVQATTKNLSGILDLDLLTYDQIVIHNTDLRIPRSDILNYAFVLKPLADIAADKTHPEIGVTYAELWRDFADKSAILADVSHFFE